MTEWPNWLNSHEPLDSHWQAGRGRRIPISLCGAVRSPHQSRWGPFTSAPLSAIIVRPLIWSTGITATSHDLSKSVWIVARVFPDPPFHTLYWDYERIDSCTFEGPIEEILHVSKVVALGCYLRYLCCTASSSPETFSRFPLKQLLGHPYFPYLQKLGRVGGGGGEGNTTQREAWLSKPGDYRFSEFLT